MSQKPFSNIFKHICSMLSKLFQLNFYRIFEHIKLFSLLTRPFFFHLPPDEVEIEQIFFFRNMRKNFTRNKWKSCPFGIHTHCRVDAVDVHRGKNKSENHNKLLNSTRIASSEKNPLVCVSNHSVEFEWKKLLRLENLWKTRCKYDAANMGESSDWKNIYGLCSSAITFDVSLSGAMSKA
jgi:hypothetical protein